MILNRAPCATDKNSKNRRRLYTPPDFFETALRNAAGRSFSGLRLAFRAAPRPLRNCSCRRRKPGMSGRRESPRTAFRARRKSGRRPIPIIYRRNHPSPLFAKRFRGRFCCRPGRFGHSVSKNYFTANSSIITFIAIFVDDRNHRRFPVRQKHPVN